ncbi:GGDEF domain-containing protein [Nocardia sp. CDC159]|uniref:GGDEF domain-containing protein n=1 Tax=Nocardia pulmonis TaxID=2951408 RepID=A0A9X2IZE9_9NOCA|nr:MULTISPECIES: GGDEF domain-containing protein [Nocardia]MCM6777428.1 GGDEF domain-containing protein [Nocardia pulmonis]MCM6790465.1 GGDEF domain-containing protein [Nocardia sp. CDC159]
MSNGRSIVRAWWRDRVDYRWLLDTFESHSALTPMRIMVGFGGAVLLVITVLSVLSRAGSNSTAGYVISTFVSLLAAAWAVRWWFFRWPSQAESLVWVALADIASPANCLPEQNRLYGALGAILLVVIGGYVTVFHGPRLLALHVAWSLLVILVLSARMVLGDPEFAGDYALAGAVVLIMVAATVVVLPPVHFCHWLLRRDALSDPLTMLLNRRGLDYYLSRYVGSYAARNGQGAYVITLDLDRFKSVNDTFGHSFGDEVLVRTAERLRAAAASRAVIARNGGEEFVVVGSLRAEDDVREIAERLRRSIETMHDLPVRITASVGVAVNEPADPAARDDDEHAARRLLRASDMAMYEAKRLGGNAVVVADPEMSGEIPAPLHAPGPA